MPDSISLTRRQLITGEAFSGQVKLRPPWSVNEPDFLTRCTGCSLCVEVCPTHILKIDKRKKAYVDFAEGECSFCHECVDVCPEKALVDKEHPWLLTATVNKQCISMSSVFCRSCGDVCPEEAINFQYIKRAIAQPVVNSEQCSGCGACISVCPVDAISISVKEERDELCSSG